MVTKKDLLLWIYELEDAINALTDDIDKLDKRIKKLEPKKGKKNEAKK